MRLQLCESLTHCDRTLVRVRLLGDVNIDRLSFPSQKDLSPLSIGRKNHNLLSTLRKMRQTHTPSFIMIPLCYRSKIFLAQVLCIFSTKALHHKSIQIPCNNAHCCLCVFAFSLTIMGDASRPGWWWWERQSFDYDYKGQIWSQLHLHL